MSTPNVTTKSAGAGLFAAVIASLCCITPVFSLFAGISGIAATFSWMEPFRIYLIIFTIGILAFAWYQKLKPTKITEIDCECEEDINPSFWQSKRFLGIVTVLSLIMITFPSYSHVFYPKMKQNNSSIILVEDSTKIKMVVFDVEGMTCTGCENHIIFEVEKLEGIKSVEASYETGTATVEFLTFKLKEEEIIETINKTGYTVSDKKESSK